MYYPSSENKGADQLRSYCEADLRLCFSQRRKSDFLMMRLINDRFVEKIWIKKTMTQFVCLPTWAFSLIVICAVVGTLIIVVILICLWRYFKASRYNGSYKERISDGRTWEPRNPVYQSGDFILERFRDRTGSGEGHYVRGRPVITSIDMIPTGEAAEPLPPLDWPAPPPPPEVEI